MRILIEIDGQKITAIGPEAAPGALEAPVPAVGDAPPGPPPPALLERAKKLGARSAGAAQFDSDITEGRYPRCALGVSGSELLAVCCDGRRTGVDGGLGMAELARLMISFGAEEAINLDGGGSATLVHRQHLLNRPYSRQDQPAPESRPVVTALLFEPV